MAPGPPFRATALWPGAGHSVQPQDTPRRQSRPCPNNHPVREPSIVIYLS